MTINSYLKIAMIIVGLGGSVWLYRKLMSSKENKRMQNNDDDCWSKVECCDEAMHEVCNAFLPYAGNFRGLYESLYGALNYKCSKEVLFNIMSEWDIRMNNIPNIPINLKAWWETVAVDIETLTEQQLKNRVSQILYMIKVSGIIRNGDAADEFVSSKCWYVKTTPVRIIEELF